MDRLSFCNISVIQQDTQYLMSKFIHNIQQLNMFRTSIVHIQERSFLYAAVWYVSIRPVVMRVKKERTVVSC